MSQHLLEKQRELRYRKVDHIYTEIYETGVFVINTIRPHIVEGIAIISGLITIGQFLKNNKKISKNNSASSPDPQNKPQKNSTNSNNEKEQFEFRVLGTAHYSGCIKCDHLYQTMVDSKFEEIQHTHGSIKYDIIAKLRAKNEEEVMKTVKELLESCGRK